MWIFNELYKQVILRIPRKWRIWVTAGLAVLIVSGLIWKSHIETRKAEVQAWKEYHAMIEGRDFHLYDQVRYKNGWIQVHWIKLPKTAKCSFTQRWFMNKVERGWVQIHNWHFPVGEAEPYFELGADPVKALKPFWGDQVFVGELQPGVYEVKVVYTYDDICFDKIGVKGWEADQRIVFEVKHKIMVTDEDVQVTTTTATSTIE